MDEALLADDSEDVNRSTIRNHSKNVENREESTDINARA